MNIKIGDFYVNKTWKYLMPCLQGYGDAFVQKFNPLFKLAVGIHDKTVDGTFLEKGHNIFILCDSKYLEKDFESFLLWVRTQEYFVADYCFDADFTKSRKRMIVLQVPENFKKTYEHFIKGEYSKMYDEDVVKTLFGSGNKDQEFKILTLDSSLKGDFIKRVNEEFGTSVYKFDEELKEYEFPLVTKEEVFNTDNTQGVYLDKQVKQ